MPSGAARWREAWTVRQWLVLAWLARHLPTALLPLVCGVSGRLSRVYARSGRLMAARHQRRATPGHDATSLRTAVDEVYASYTHYWLESLRLPALNAGRVERGISVEGFDHVEAALAAGRGVILALPHLGGWEWAGRWLASRGIEVVAVAEELEPPALFEWMARLRGDLGITVVPLNSSAGSAVLQALRRNAVVCLLCDRDIHGGGVPVSFMGEPTTLPAGPAALALRTGAALLPTAVPHTDRREGHLGIVLPPIDTDRNGRSLRQATTEVSAALADQLADLIRMAPTQWHLVQPNWESDR